jgi:hypothetical protein
MATTIKLKNGSGAPLAGDLVQGEPAFDLTNKRLYTEDSGGTVIEVGTNPTSLTTGTFTSTGIDDNATSTAITIDSNENVILGSGGLDVSGIGGTYQALNMRAGSGYPVIYGQTTNTATNSAGLQLVGATSGASAGGSAELLGVIQIAAAADSSTNAAGYINFYTGNGSGSVTERMRIDSSGNVLVGTDDGAFVNGGGIKIANATAARLKLCDSNSAGTGSADGFELTQSGTAAYIYQNENDFMAFGTNATEAMRIDASGNVGIGTTSPSTYDSRANNLVVGDSGDAGITIFSGATSNARLQFAPSSDTGLNNGLIDYDNNDDSMAFATGGSERMRINSSGNVSIGTTSPAAKLHINGTGDLIRLTSTNSSSGGAQIDLMHFSPSPANGDIHSYINFGGYYSGTSQAYGSSIRGVWNGVGAREGQIHFYTRKGDSFTEKMRLDEDGNVLVGTTTAVGTGDEGVQIGPNVIITGRDQTSDQIHHIFKNPNGTVGTIRTLNSATSYVTSSDARLKENIVDAPAGNIDAIRVRSFDWKADGSHQTYGMVAQELVDVAPEAVSQGETEDDMWGVDYSKLVPMMIKEIQDLKAEVAALKGA